MKYLSLIILATTMSSAIASNQLALNGKTVKCYGPDNVEIILNANRTSLKYTIEGESAGAKRITKTITDNRTYTSYKTSEGTLRLGKVDTYSESQSASDEPYEVECR